MIHALRHVLASRRAEAGATLRDIEEAGIVDRANISRFENGAGSRDLDALVHSYAAALSRVGPEQVTPLELWTAALDLYADDRLNARATAALRGRRAAAQRASHSAH